MWSRQAMQRDPALKGRLLQATGVSPEDSRGVTLARHKNTATPEFLFLGVSKVVRYIETEARMARACGEERGGGAAIQLQ